MTENAKEPLIPGGQILQEQVFFLSEILDNNILWQGKKIGKLEDVIVLDREKIAEVTHLYVSRPFGDPKLYIPWEKVKSIDKKEAVIDIESIGKYEAGPAAAAVLFKDHVLDKRVLDIEGREVEVVYDARMIIRGAKLFITGVDLSRYGMLRRIGLKGIANFIHNLAFTVGARSLYSERLKWLANFIYGLANKVKDRTLSWAYVQPLPEEMDAFKGEVRLNILKEKLEDMPAVDLADILEELDPEQRVIIFDKLDSDHAADTLEEIDPNVQRALISSLRKEKVAELINLMTPGQAADLLSALSFADARAILKMLKRDLAEKIRSILDKQEQRIFDFATADFLKLSPEMTAHQALDEYAKAAKHKEIVLYVYVADPADKLLGVVDLKELLVAGDEAKLRDFMKDQVIRLHPENTLKEAAGMFNRYGFRAIPITDENDRIIGVVPYRDVMNLKHRFLE
jgi:CBS domain-containing protein